MPKRLLWSCVFACGLLLGGVSIAAAEDAANLLVIKNPTIANPSMPRVVFNHDAHEAYVDAHQGDCSKCHSMTKEGLSTSFSDVQLQKPNNQVSFMHQTCTACHKASGHGPLLVKCRSCHTQPDTQAMK
ncbi:MAG: cytochrome c3 family protein [Desulfovibrionaceae bacterium]|nr:cytochrome c3 family protein [Desulfovibrionaceae bacterium]